MLLIVKDLLNLEESMRGYFSEGILRTIWILGKRELLAGYLGLRESKAIAGSISISSRLTKCV